MRNLNYVLLLFMIFSSTTATLGQSFNGSLIPTKGDSGIYYDPSIQPFYYENYTDTITTYDFENNTESVKIERGYRPNFSVQVGDVLLPADRLKPVYISNEQKREILTADNINIICNGDYLLTKEENAFLLILQGDEAYVHYWNSGVNALRYEIDELFVVVPVKVSGKDEKMELMVELLFDK